MKQEDKEKALEEIKKGKSVRKIAIKYNISPQHLYFLMKPIENQKHLNKKRYLMKKLKDSA